MQLQREAGLVAAGSRGTDQATSSEGKMGGPLRSPPGPQGRGCRAGGKAVWCGRGLAITWSARLCTPRGSTASARSPHSGSPPPACCACALGCCPPRRPYRSILGAEVAPKAVQRRWDGERNRGMPPFHAWVWSAARQVSRPSCPHWPAGHPCPQSVLLCLRINSH